VRLRNRPNGRYTRFLETGRAGFTMKNPTALSSTRRLKRVSLRGGPRTGRFAMHGAREGDRLLRLRLRPDRAVRILAEMGPAAMVDGVTGMVTERSKPGSSGALQVGETNPICKGRAQFLLMERSMAMKRLRLVWRGSTRWSRVFGRSPAGRRLPLSKV
jgi:hypothetical protein